MIQRFKYLLYALLAVLGLFVGLLVILPFIIDPNDYKPEITSLVEEHTGRSLQIEGDLELTVFPWLGIRTGRLELGNAEGFEGDIFVAVNSTQVRVKLFPLLSRNIEIGRVIIRGFEANLRRNNDGISNWQDLVETAGADDDVEQPDPNVETESGSAGFNTLQLGGLQIENGRFSFIDEQAGTRYDISNFTVETGRLAPNEPVEFSLALQLAASQPQVKGSFEIQTTLLANAKDQVYALQSGSFKFSGTLQDFLKEELTAGLTWQAMTFNNTEQQLDVNEANFSGLGVTATTSFVASNLDGEPSLVGSVHVPPFSLQELANRFSEMLPEGTNLPPGSQMEFESDFNVNLNTQALRINALRLGLADLKLLASINGEQIIDAPRFSGSLQTENFSPTRLLVNLGQTAIPTTDPNALSSASLATKFTATQSSVALSEMNLALDQTLLKGQFAIADFDKQAIRFDLIVDAIDADRYLPPVEAAAETPPEEGEPLDAIQLPVDPIQTLDIKGRFRIGKLHAFSMNTSNIDFSVSAGKGVVRIHPVKADLYDGQYSGDILYRIDRKVPLVSINESISEIQISGLSMDLFDENRISGITNMQIKLRGVGNTVGEVRSSLRGNLAFELHDGAVVGVDLTSALKNAFAIYKGEKSKQDSADQGKTEFAELKGSGLVRNGVWTTKDLGAEVLNIVVNGKGTINLATEALDLELKTTIKPKQKRQEGLDIPELENVPIIIPVQCVLSAPCMKMPKLNEALKAKLKQETRKKRKKLKEESKEKLKDKLKDIFGG